jgi:integrase
MRTITVPTWVMDIFRRRYETAHGPWVFPSTAGTLRGAENARSQLRRGLKETESERSASARVPAAVTTRLDAKGLSAREIADYLSHGRVSMTQDVYMARRVTGAMAADAIAGLDPIESGE